jgi:aspartyl-tRNA(Asn)/glutamyl-tRNA(Gln) amidotransferase subunit A
VPDYAAELAGPVAGWTVGVPRGWFFDALAPDVAAAIEAAIARLAELEVRTVDVSLSRLEEVLSAHRAIIFAEAGSFHEPYLADRAGDYGDDIRPLLLAGRFMLAVDYVKAQRLRRLVRREWSKVLAAVDCLLTPTAPVAATGFGQEAAELPGGPKPLVRAYLDPTLPFNFTGHPALSVPCGFSRDGLPIGMQLVGRPYGEAAILRLAHHYQQATDWHRRMPGGL